MYTWRQGGQVTNDLKPRTALQGHVYLFKLVSSNPSKHGTDWSCAMTSLLGLRVAAPLPVPGCSGQIAVVGVNLWETLCHGFVCHLRSEKFEPEKVVHIHHLYKKRLIDQYIQDAVWVDLVIRKKEEFSKPLDVEKESLKNTENLTLKKKKNRVERNLPEIDRHL